MNVVRVRIRITGIVQGVGFRPFVYRIAVKNDLDGYVRNRGDAGVEIHLEGREENIRKFLRDLKEKKPSVPGLLAGANNSGLRVCIARISVPGYIPSSSMQVKEEP